MFIARKTILMSAQTVSRREIQRFLTYPSFGHRDIKALSRWAELN
jgi:hypothetical protein